MFGFLKETNDNLYMLQKTEYVAWEDIMQFCFGISVDVDHDMH